MRRKVWVVASLVWGCAPLVGDLPPESGASAAAGSAEPPGVPAPPVSISLPAPARPDWLSKGKEAPDSVFDGKRVTSVGRRTAVAVSGPADAFAWAIDTEHERVHRLRPPAGSVRLLVAGANDAIVAITDAGEVFRAPDPAAAREPTGFVRLGKQPGVTSWDAAGNWLVGASGADVLISKNAGETFRRQSVIASGEVVVVMVREDGLVLASADGGLYISRGGYAFRRSPTTVWNLRRAGRWIFGEAASSCSGELAVLAAGTTTWMRDDESAREFPDPARVLELSPTATGWTKARYFTFEGPPAPALDSKRALPPDPPAMQAFGCDHAQLSSGSRHTAKWRLKPGPETAQMFLVDHAVAPSVRKLALLGNARCAQTDSADGRCDSDGELTHPSQAVRYDASGADVIELPSDCLRSAADNYGGLGMLTCEGDTPRYFVDGVGAELRAETVPYPIEPGGSQGPDGSILFASRCSDPKKSACPWVVRRGAPPGSSDAWWTFTAKDAIALRLLEGGRVLVVRRSGVHAPANRGPLQTVVRLGLVAPDEPERTIALDVVLHDLTFDVTAENGHVVFVGRDTRWALLEDGSLMEL